jgi:two-component system, NtrC family, C4-dicarboxylate transport sensor histidine kinase DctB
MVLRKNKYILGVIISLILVTIFSIFIGIYFILGKEKDLLEKRYSDLTANLKDKVHSLIHTKENATLSIAIALAENDKIRRALLNEEIYDLNELSKKLNEYTDFKNVWLQLIDKNGVSVYRSWTNDRFDKIKNIRLDLQELYKNPEIKSTISIGKYDITFKSIVPIYQNNQFLGVLDIVTHFNSITKALNDSDKLESFVIVEKEFTKQLKEQSFSKIFIQNYYVANVFVNKEILNYLDKQDLETMFELENYLIKDNNLIINVPIIESGKKLANFLIIKDLKTIDTLEIEQFKIHAFWYLAFFIALLCSTISFIGYFIYSKKLKELNSSLEQTVSSEILKNDEKNRILFQQNKMAAMGEMIENIAHQWRQPLSVITTVASSLKLKKEYDILSDEEYNQDLNHIVETANYLSNTIDDFRYYFSPNKDKNLFNTKGLINRCLNIVNIDFSNKHIKIVQNVEELTMFNFENELLQVMINILNNSKDELIKIEDEQDRVVFINLYKEQNELIIKIKDSAGGIPKEIIDRVFEPYFTTKHKSKGTGIGLYMCEEIITKHIKGKIKVSNEEYIYEDKNYIGALFEISIPIE